MVICPGYGEEVASDLAGLFNVTVWTCAGQGLWAVGTRFLPTGWATGAGAELVGAPGAAEPDAGAAEGTTEPGLRSRCCC